MKKEVESGYQAKILTIKEVPMALWSYPDEDSEVGERLVEN
jgi:hypothetical protein